MKKLLTGGFLFWGSLVLAQNNYVATSPTSQTPGGNNTIIGINAGQSVVDAQRNLMLGNSAGSGNKSARDNIYIGHIAASKDTSKNIGESIYIGNEVALNLKKGQRNVLIGFRAAQNATLMDETIIMGYNAGSNLGGGFANILIGPNAGTSYTGIFRTVCIGQSSGGGPGGITPTPKTGDRGTYIGHEAAGADNLNNATAIGAGAFVSLSNSLILGSTGVNVGIGNSAPLNKLEITHALPNQSGLRFTNLTSKSPASTSTGKVLSVDTHGDVILTAGTDLTAVLSRLDAIEKLNSTQRQQITALQQTNDDLKKRVETLEGQLLRKK
ncbi:hypothetical protein [Spirosoma gilvum]